jgi:hypothetical protein
MSSIFIFKEISYSIERLWVRGGILLHFCFCRSGDDVRESETDLPTRETRALPGNNFAQAKFDSEKIVSATRRKSEPDWLSRLAACAPQKDPSRST